MTNKNSIKSEIDLEMRGISGILSGLGGQDGEDWSGGIVGTSVALGGNRFRKPIRVITADTFSGRA